MTDQNSSSSDVLSALPHRRPHRRSDKRAARPAKTEAVNEAPRAKKEAPRAKETPRAKKEAPRAKATSTGPATKPTPATRPAPKRLRQPAQPAGAPPSPRSRASVPTTGADVLGTAVHAAAELAEIGLTAGARALRNAVARLPKP
jgi:hypothetical protein